MTTLSVLICTYNRPHFLARCLGALLTRTEEKPDEVIVVNGGDERADDVVDRFRRVSDVPLILVKTINKNLAASRNVGLPYCRGDIIAMTDDDAEVFPDWVWRMKVAHQQHPEAGAVGGAVIGAKSTTSMISRLADIVTFPSPPEPMYVRTLPGVNVSYKRSVIERLGPQDETLFRGEDVDYNWRVQKLGYRVYYDPSIRVLHHHRPTFFQFLHQHYMYGRAYYLVRRKWPDMYAVYPRAIQRPRDLLKGVYFVASVFLDALRMAWKLSSWSDRVVALPLLTLNNAIWKGGMVVQWWITRTRANGN